MRPEFVETGVFAFVRRPAEARDIVHQRIKPYISYEIMVKRQFDAEPDAALGTGNAQIVQRFGQHSQHFFGKAPGLYPVRMGVDIINQPLAILLEREEIVFFGNQLRRLLVVGAETALIQVRGLFELFAAFAVQAFVRLFADKPLVVDIVQRFGYDGLVFIGRSADEVVVINVHLVKQVAEVVAAHFEEFRQGKPAFLTARLVFLPVFVGAGGIENVSTAHLLKLFQDVAQNRRISVADVRRTVDVINRSGEIFLHRNFLCVVNKKDGLPRLI